MAIDDVIERAAFAAFKSGYIQHGERAAEKEWARRLPLNPQLEYKYLGAFPEGEQP